MNDIIRRAAKSIVDLGISSKAALSPHIEAWVNRPLSGDTQDEDMELAGFLTNLYRAQIITRKQGRTLLQMLTEPAVAHAPAPSDDPYSGRRFGSFVAEAHVFTSPGERTAFGKEAPTTASVTLKLFQG